VYIKHCPSINKQFSIDSFLDWEGLLLGFRYAHAHALFPRKITPPLSDAYSIVLANNDDNNNNLAQYKDSSDVIA